MQERAAGQGMVFGLSVLNFMQDCSKQGLNLS